MAKFAFYEVKSMEYEVEKDSFGRAYETPRKQMVDNVHLQFDKKVANSTMRGEKADFYSIPIADLPFVFLKPDVKFPAMGSNGDCSERIAAIHKFLAPYHGKNCIVEVVMKSNGKAPVLASVEFD
jgi:hypothetical protein